jgi:signal transduction histidine kinase
MTATGGRRRPSSPARLCAAAAAAGTALTVAVVAVPAVRFAYRAPAAHVMLETANAVVALVVAYLLFGRFAGSRRVQDLLLTLALCAVAVANLVLTAVPSAVSLGGEDISQWAAVATRLLGTTLLAGAALVPRRLHLGHRAAVEVTAGFATTLVALGALGVLFAGHLPPIVDPGQPLGDASRPQLVAHPVVLCAQGVGAALYALAAVTLVRRSRSGPDELIRWLAAGCVLAAVARVHYLLYPSLYSEFVYTGDLLRLASYLCMLLGAAREVRSFWELRTEAAVAEDRRRMARDLHDGLTQELSYIWTQSRMLAGRPDDAATAERINGSAERAIDEARRAIAALTQPADRPFPQLLQQLADELAFRHDVKVVTAIDPAVEVSADRADALLRITGEAIRNAVRHGGAERVDLVLDAAPLSLSAIDDGCGFAVGAPGTHRPGGFGLVSMRERAASVGAELSITSAPGEGTTIRVAWP